MNRRDFLDHGARLTGAMMLYDKPAALGVSVDISIAGIAAAWANSAQLSGGLEPQLLLISPSNYHLAEWIISGLPLHMKCLAVVQAHWLEPDAWLLGNVNAPGGWVGSEGA